MPWLFRIALCLFICFVAISIPYSVASDLGLFKKMLKPYKRPWFIGMLGFALASFLLCAAGFIQLTLGL